MLNHSISLEGYKSAGVSKKQLISFEDASKLIAMNAEPLGSEWISLERADGRILAKPVMARRTSPSVLLSAMDGYAVRDSDIADMPASLEIAGKSFAGNGFGKGLPPRACVRVFTGAPVPNGAERVVMQEDVCTDGAFAVFSHPPAKTRHLRFPGSDFSKGDVIAEAGRLLTPQRLVGIAASGNANLEVFRQPSVAILCCGDELVEPGLATFTPDGIPESISYGVAALVRRWGGTIADRHRLPDDLSRLQDAAHTAAAIADVVVVIGGASVGERDFAKQAFAALGLDPLFTKVAIKPGKPVWFGRMGRTYVVGLPGNPTSALVTARLFLAPLLAGLSGGRADDALDWQMTPAATAIAGCNDRDLFIRATMACGCAMPLSDQDSAGQKALADATLLIWQGRGTSPVGANTPIKTLIL
ncbi:MAG: molybdopterin molybdotransferase MoeA [Alphaproteobacteria bacterium]|nr:molybdopterin molybdotransferase MoeA [Alphaproteobacteria bacterium]